MGLFKALEGPCSICGTAEGPFTGLKDGSICERCSYCVALGVPCRTQKRENTFRQTYDIITLAGMAAPLVGKNRAKTARLVIITRRALFVKRIFFC